MSRWQGKQHTVAVLVSFTELPSILELSRFGADDRRTACAAVPLLVNGWLNYSRVPASWRHTRSTPGGPRSGAKLGTRPQCLKSTAQLKGVIALLRQESFPRASGFQSRSFIPRRGFWTKNCLVRPSVMLLEVDSCGSLSRALISRHVPTSPEYPCWDLFPRFNVSSRRQ